jgi:hypothetical protein
MIVAADAPGLVRTAIVLLWASILISVIQQVVETSIFGVGRLGTVLVVLAIYALVIFRASRRHNWARYVLLLWTALAAALYATGLRSDDRPLWDHLLVVASFLVEIAGVLMLFAATARQWYGRKSSK